MIATPEFAASPEPIRVRLSGELDMAAEDTVRGELYRARAHAQEAGVVVVDLSQVTFMDCSALHPLMETRRALGHRLVLHRPAPRVTRLLQLAQLDDILVIEDEQ
jgi:anti-anti-sigma factor